MTLRHTLPLSAKSSMTMAPEANEIRNNSVRNLFRRPDGELLLKPAGLLGQPPNFGIWLSLCAFAEEFAKPDRTQKH